MAPATRLATGSIASQGVAMAMGMQSGFNWRAVALSAVGGAVTAGVGQTVLPGTNTWGAVATRAAISNVVTQGIAVATGLQKSFDWRAVAASSAGAAVGNQLASKQPLTDPFQKFANATVSGFGSGATASILKGGRLNVIQVATDAFGNALGSSLADAMRSGGSPSGGASGGSPGNGQSGLSDVIAKANATPERGAMNYTDYGYEQARPLADRLGLVSGPQMSMASNSGPGSGDYLEFSTNLPETPIAGEMYQANATYHRGTDALEAAAASDEAFYRDAKNNATSGLSAVGWHIGGLLNETGYDLARTGRGVYRLATDANTRAAAYGALKYAINNPGAVLENTINGVKNFSNKPFAEQADSVFKFAAGGLATAGAGKVVQVGASPIMQGGKWALETGYIGAQDYAVKTWLRMQSTEALGGTWQQVYESAADGTRRLGFNFGDLTGFRAVNSEASARYGNFFSLERPVSPGAAIERSALIPEWGNRAGELYQVEARRGFYFKGVTAPQYSDMLGRTLEGGNTQIFQTKVIGSIDVAGKPTYLPTWKSVKDVSW